MMLDLDTYPLAPGHRGVDTSKAAAEAITPTVGRLQRLVLEAIRDAGSRGLTTNEVAHLLDIDRGSVQPRTSELKLFGLILDSRLRRLNANGKKAIVWIAVKESAHG